MKGLLQIVACLLFFVAVAYLLLSGSWLLATIKLIQGGMLLMFFFMGLGLVLLGVSELRG